MKVRLHAEALLDIDEAALWYEEQEPGLGDEFLDELNGRSWRGSRTPSRTRCSTTPS